MIVPHFTFRMWKYRGAKYYDRICTIHLGCFNIDIFPHASNYHKLIVCRVDYDWFWQSEMQPISRKERNAGAIESPLYTLISWMKRKVCYRSWTLSDVRTGIK